MALLWIAMAWLAAGASLLFHLLTLDGCAHPELTGILGWYLVPGALLGQVCAVVALTLHGLPVHGQGFVKTTCRFIAEHGGLAARAVLPTLLYGIAWSAPLFFSPAAQTGVVPATHALFLRPLSAALCALFLAQLSIFAALHRADPLEEQQA